MGCTAQGPNPVSRSGEASVGGMCKLGRNGLEVVLPGVVETHSVP